MEIINSIYINMGNRRQIMEDGISLTHLISFVIMASKWIIQLSLARDMKTDAIYSLASMEIQVEVISIGFILNIAKSRQLNGILE